MFYFKAARVYQDKLTPKCQIDFLLREWGKSQNKLFTFVLKFGIMCLSQRRIEMKKFLGCAICFMVLICSILTGCSNNSTSVTVDGVFYKKVTVMHNGANATEGYYVAGCKAGTKILNIAAEVKGLPVLGFNKVAFKDNTELKEVIIPNSIEKIALNTAPFSGCNNIEKITMPFSNLILLFNSYGGGSSGNTMPSSLKVVYLSNACQKISTSDFYYCTSLEEVHIPSSVTEIVDGTGYTIVGANGHEVDSNKFNNLPFLGCSNLTIYCEVASKPNGWGAYWNYIDSEHHATVHWGNY